MPSLPIGRLSPREFLKWERKAERKHEYRDGEVYARADRSPSDSLVVSNLQVALGRRLDASSCFVFNCDLRVATRRGELISYPDITVLCEEPQYFDEKRDTLTNPTLIVALRRATPKIGLYRGIPSLREIVLVDSAPTMIEHHWKLPNGHWEVEVVADSGAAIGMESLGFDLPVAEVYSNIDVL